MRQFLCIGTIFLLAAGNSVRADDGGGPAEIAGGSMTNSIGMKLVRVEPGTFLMGQQEGGDFDERPVHRVTLSRGFWMGVTEVTNAQYEQFDPAHKAMRGIHGISTEDDEPVVHVCWHDAVRFCKWLSKREGRPCRLPTEAEWEYACRAGTETPYSTGTQLPAAWRRNQKQLWDPAPIKLTVSQSPANAWGLHDMHGNVEEWCSDWYGPYEPGDQTDPAGCANGDFKVTRGGSYSTTLEYLRSANRMGTLPDDKHWLIGFRIVVAEYPSTPPVGDPEKALWAQDVSQSPSAWTQPAGRQPHFFGPVDYVKIPPGSNGPLYSKHNHCPAITACPNGDLLAVWYSTNTEPGRELTVLASRLRHGSNVWQPASVFWDAPDRNDHGNEVWWDGKDTLYHFNGLGTDGTWGKLALVMRTSTDNGATWSAARLINPEHGLRNQVISGAVRTAGGDLIVKCDAVTGGSGGTAVHVSSDGGQTWGDPGLGRPTPRFADGQAGAWIAGIHAGLVQLADGNLMALGRGDSINGRMPMSLSTDMGRTWTYSASEFTPISSGQRLVLMRLREGPIVLLSFTDASKGLVITDASGRDRQAFGLFAALSFDEGKTWPTKKLITPGGSATLDGGAWTRTFTLDDTHAEPKGYLAATQTPDGMIHLISSRLYYRFNMAWLVTGAGSGSDSGRQGLAVSEPDRRKR
ncbi:MAG: SUMF1/EgtB/PvdO family nonheme iron enzyme [Phycisphaerae bacterium]|nr:SUMF1/EgtB/PvdO family nonheme iron enzyme [Phycisphaerae bacterium]